MYHKILNAGKNIQIAGNFRLNDVLPMKKEFNRDFYRFMIGLAEINTKEEALNAIDLLSL